MTPTAIAHRGEPVGHRENTLPAFAAGAALGADMLELDLRRTRDGAIVVLHDQTLERLWGLEDDVGDLTLADIQALDQDGVQIPTLSEVLDTVPLPLMVDFTRREHVTGGLGAVTAADALGRCLFVTGNVEALRLLRRLSPAARIGLTWTEGADPPLDLLEELGAECWNPYFGFVTEAGVAAVHATGRKVTTWTVDDRDDMAQMMAAGVDGIVSNHVAALVAFLGT